MSLVSSAFRDPFFRTLDDVMTFEPWLSGMGGYTTPGNVLSNVNARNPVRSLIKIDAFEADNQFKVICEVPGVPKDKIDVSVDNNLLTIKCNKECPEMMNNACNMTRNEVCYGSDVRSIRIPNSFSMEACHCCCKDGVLCISFPKSESHESKKLEIQSS